MGSLVILVMLAQSCIKLLKPPNFSAKKIENPLLTQKSGLKSVRNLRGLFSFFCYISVNAYTRSRALTVSRHFFFASGVRAAILAATNGVGQLSLARFR
jgi:hypothetical protein